MSAYDMNDQIMGGVMAGMSAAADRFAQRMQDIHDENVEEKRSKFWHDYALNLAKQVDELTGILNKQNVLLAEKELLLRQTTTRLQSFRNHSAGQNEYLDLVIKRLINVEDTLQRQSARAFALDEFGRLAVHELETIKDPKLSILIDPVKQSEILNKSWDEFMKTTNVKRGIPRPGIDKP